MTPEADAILRVFQSRRLGTGSNLAFSDFGDTIVWQTGSAKGQRIREGFIYLKENGYVNEHLAGLELTESGSRYLQQTGQEGAEDPTEFAYEKHLQSFLAKNLSVIESGLRLYQKGAETGVEFPAGGRSIDILAVDTQNCLVVFELKVSKGYDRAVGQLLRYMGWIKKHLAEPEQAVRGIIVAREISEDLRYACAIVPAVALHEYQLSFETRQIESHTAESSKPTEAG